MKSGKSTYSTDILVRESALIMNLPFCYRLKSSGEQVDDRIVEVFWEKPGRWRMMRFRDDKPHGNHKSVVENIIRSIVDGVEKEDVRNISPNRL